MISTKITLSTDDETVIEAKRLAVRHRGSVSAMFTRFVHGLKSLEREDTDIEIGSVTQRASGMIKLPANMDDNELVATALGEKYRV